MSQVNEPDLNTLARTGLYFQTAMEKATTAKHYPVANQAGLLEVISGDPYAMQRYTTYGTQTVYTRFRSYDYKTWSAWKQV